MRYAALIFLGLLVALVQPARADIYTYFPSTTLVLGRGFDPLDTTKSKADCFDYETETAVDGLGGGSVSSDIHFTIKQVTDSRELHTLLKTSLSLSGHYEMFSADGSTNSSSEIDTLGSSTSWVLFASTDYGRYRAKNLHLKPAFAALTKDLPSLVERCGTDVVMQVKRGVSLAIIFTLTNSAQTRDEALNQKFNASVGGDMWGVNANGSLDSSLHEAITHGELMLNVVVAGGEGVPGLADLITELKDQNTVGATKAVLAAFAKRLGPERAAITEYQTGSLSAFIPGLKVPAFTIYNQLIGEYTLALNQNLLWLSRLSNYLAGSDDMALDQKRRVINAYGNVRARTFDITSEAIHCRDRYQAVVQALAVNKTLLSLQSAKKTDDSLRTIEAQQRVELQKARLEGEQGHRTPNLLETLPFVGKQNPTSARLFAPCEFHPVWLDFSEYVNLPPYPFDAPVTWVDNLDQGSTLYRYISIKGTSIKSAKLIDRKNGSILISLERRGNYFDTLRDAATDDTEKLAILVVTRSGRDFTVRIDD